MTILQSSTRRTLILPGGRFVSKRRGNPELVMNGDFALWTADNPDGWTVGGENGSNFVTEVAGGSRFVSPAVGQTALFITQQIAVDVGDTIKYTVVVDSVTSGIISLRVHGGLPILNITTSGTHEITRTVSQPAENKVEIWRRLSIDNDFVIAKISAVKA